MFNIQNISFHGILKMHFACKCKFSEIKYDETTAQVYSMIQRTLYTRII